MTGGGIACTYLPEFTVAVSGRGRGEKLRSQEHEEEVVRGRRGPAPRRVLLQVGPHGRQARRQ